MGPPQPSTTVVLCTGASGSGRDEFLASVKEYAAKRGKQFEVKNVGDYIARIVREATGRGVSKERILNIDEARLRAYRELAFERIKTEIRSPGCHVVSTPVFVKWNGRTIKCTSQLNVETLDPDIVVTIIDDVIRIRERLKKDRQWKNKQFSIKDLVEWRGIEIDETIEYTHNLNRYKPEKVRPHCVIPWGHPLETLYDLIFPCETGKMKKRIYFSFPMTHVTEELEKEKREFCQELRKYYVVFDPATMLEYGLVFKYDEEVEKSKLTAKPLPNKISIEVTYPDGKRVTLEADAHEIADAKIYIEDQVVTRDFTLIEQSDYVVVFYPQKELAAGVICEMMYGATHDKRVIAMHPYRPSPFFRFWCDQRTVFKNKDEFLSFLKDESAK